MLPDLSGESGAGQELVLAPVKPEVGEEGIDSVTFRKQHYSVASQYPTLGQHLFKSLYAEQG